MDLDSEALGEFSSGLYTLFICSRVAPSPKE